MVALINVTRMSVQAEGNGKMLIMNAGDVSPVKSNGERNNHRSVQMWSERDALAFREQKHHFLRIMPCADAEELLQVATRYANSGVADPFFKAMRELTGEDVDTEAEIVMRKAELDGIHVRLRAMGVKAEEYANWSFEKKKEIVEAPEKRFVPLTVKRKPQPPPTQSAQSVEPSASMSTEELLAVARAPVPDSMAKGVRATAMELARLRERCEKLEIGWPIAAGAQSLAERIKACDAGEQVDKYDDNHRRITTVEADELVG